MNFIFVKLFLFIDYFVFFNLIFIVYIIYYKDNIGLENRE